MEERLDLFTLLDLAVTVTDPGTGRIQRVNEAACVLLGRPEPELIGLRWRDVAVPEERALWHQEIHRPEANSSRRRLVRLLRPDHSVVHAVVSSARLPAADGDGALLIQLQDISDEIAANERLRLILDNTPVSMFLVDRDGMVLASKGLMDAVASRISRHPDTSAFELFADMPVAVALLRRALGGEPVHQVIDVLTRCYDLHMVPIFGRDREVSYLTCVATDVTEHQRLLATLRTRSVEQSLIASLGQQALESLSATALWQHAASLLARHLRADTVRIHELDGAGNRTRLLAAVTRQAPPRARAPTTGPESGPESGPEPEPASLGPRLAETVERAVDSDADLCPADATSGLAVGGHSLVVATGRGDHPLAAVEVDRQPSVAPFTEQDAQFVRSVGAVLGAAAMRFRTEEDIRRQSLHDGLTGLPNRVALLDRLDRALRRARADQSRIGVLFIDLDGFKTVNDTLGHQAGDHLLRLAATRLEHAVRPGDVVGRLSGDEFAILCEHIDSPDDIEAIADRILTTLDTPCVLDQQTVMLSASVGLALSEPETTSGEDLLGAADIAMYTAKRRGPGRRAAFDEAMRTRLVARLTEQGELRRAVDAQELVLRYQPIREVGNGLVGAEATPHWRHPRRGLLAPSGFLPGREQIGLRVPIDRWLIGRACRDVARWEGGALPDGHPLLLMAVSGPCLVEPRFVPELDVLLASTGARARYRLCFEIAEQEIVADEEAVLPVLQSLTGLGVSVCIGEYGATRPIVSKVPHFPFGYLRISGAYVDGVDVNPVRQAAAAAIVHFAHQLGVRTVAGDVSTREQYDMLRSLRCDLALGPAVGPRRPEPPRLAASHLDTGGPAGPDGAPADDADGADDAG
ncbi:PAS domain S-box/diguanylate cyclase (GGDEF) domain-containing protein [Frankia canadensis]|uniref:PAS domain S-box/diguanylate cyclase (GGDEF) domain-containing protein n=1 Tax=Frankia canadensis TaxID=1836972 RepID=A0A2I2KMH3_9ACTN|nr:PAS domain S-box/diguanylate cyclase (GGDEF) domain-containing protein [Frankia canadensis]SOU54146.1 PAS domain S-box/diguanylate cyclase (GGDEF) domain-containing protein [Frankia canadensis]